MLLDYETLRILWWALLGILLIGFVITDGYDLGTMLLLPFVARTDLERSIAIHTVSPVWEANQVWLLLGGGAIFAAWPLLYSAAFSGFYLAMFLALVALIVRPVAFKFRSKRQDRQWRGFWEWALFVGAIVDSLIFGVAFGNLFTGVDFSFDRDLRFMPDITLFDLLGPFALLAGIISLLMIALHGATWLNYKASGAVAERCQRLVLPISIALLVLYSIAGWWMSQLDGYQITSAIATDASSNPFLKEVAKVPGAWMAIFREQPLWLIVPGLAYLAAILAVIFASKKPLWAVLASALIPFGIIGSAGRALFPFFLPSASHPSLSLTVWDASSSHTTLAIMFFAAIILMPVVLGYTAWIYRVLRGKVTAEDISGSDQPY